MYATIGAFEAKAALLQAIKQGKRFTIIVRGEPVADLIPTNTRQQNTKAAVQAFDSQLAKAMTQAGEKVFV